MFSKSKGWRFRPRRGNKEKSKERKKGRIVIMTIRFTIVQMKEEARVENHKKDSCNKR